MGLSEDIPLNALRSGVQSIFRPAGGKMPANDQNLECWPANASGLAAQFEPAR